MKLELAPEDRTKLERWLKGRTMSDKIKGRARIVLMTADNRPTSELMEILGVANKTLNLW